MTVSEFSDQFDALVIASYRRFKNFDDKEELDSVEFNEYEKSVFLTQAQEELVLSLYNGRNSSLQSFEETEELRRYLSGLIEEETISPIANTGGKPIGIDSDKKTRFFSLPTDLWFITYESVKLDADDRPCAGIGNLEVVPVTQDEYHRIRKNPFRGANDRRALRLDLSEDVVEIVSSYTVESYYVRYLKKLSPIVLVDLPNGLTIGHRGLKTECQAHEGLHRRILELAVEKGLRSKFGGGSSTATNRTDRE